MFEASSIQELEDVLRAALSPSYIQYMPFSNSFSLDLSWGAIKAAVEKVGDKFAVNIDGDLPKE